MSSEIMVATIWLVGSLLASIIMVDELTKERDVTMTDFLAIILLSSASWIAVFIVVIMHDLFGKTIVFKRKG